MSEKKKSFSAAYMILAGIILIQLLYSTFMFVYKKNGTHSDEIWSYGLANSYYKPFVYLPDGIYQDEYRGGYEGSDITGKWIDGKVMNDYVTVQKGERFTYDSVYHNQVLDHHPPLYYSILHTICSFFPDRFSLWYAYAINIVSMVFIQIFLFKIMKMLSGSDKTALICCLLYGGGVGALSTMMFLRQYGFMTMLITMIWYWNLKMYRSYDKEKGFDLKHNVPYISVLSFLLFFTNYTTCMVVGIFTACMCLYMLIRKRIKQMFIYGISMVAALGAFIAAYPYVTSHVGMYDDAVNMDSNIWPYGQRLRLVLNHVLGDTIGIHFSLFSMGYTAYVLAALVLLTALCVPLCILFRKETWFVKFKEKLTKKLKNTPKWLKSWDVFLVMLLIPNLAFVLILPNISDIVAMGRGVSRYVFICYPVVCIIAVYAVYKLTGAVTRKYVMHTLAVIAAAVVAYVNISTECPFLFSHSKGYTDIAELTADKNVVLFASGGDSEVWYTQCFPAYLRKAESIYITFIYDKEADDRIADGRGVDVVIAPLASFRNGGEWYKMAKQLDPERFKELEERWISGVDNDYKERNDENMSFADDHLDALYGEKSAEVVCCMNIQDEDYVVVRSVE
jgi:hypothetical protein